MKQNLRTIILLWLILIPYIASADITLRSVSPTMNPRYRVKTYTPSFDMNQAKHNIRIERTNCHFTNHHNSYLTDEVKHNTQVGQKTTLHGRETTYYHRYTPQKSVSTTVSYSNHIAMKSYNPSNNTPFEGGDAVVAIGFTQYAYGPPAEGPVSDVIIPLLLFVSLYIVAIKRNIRQ